MGYPGYLSDVLTGVASYTLAANTSPTTQSGATGSLGGAALNVNFASRTLDLQLGVSIAGAGGGQWQLSASNVPIALNTFFGSTADRLAITNGAGASSRTNSNLAGRASREASWARACRARSWATASRI